MLAMLWNGAKLILMGLLSVAVLFFFGGSEDNGGQSLHHSGSYEPAQLSAPADTGNGDKSWTVMMYLCGSDLESENGLATDNLKELCAANLGGRINYLIETGGAKRWNNNVVDSQHLNRYIVENGGITLKQQLASASMGEASTLSDFLKWGKSTYPADNYMLVFWDHGGGTLTGVCYDERYSHGSSDADTLTLPEIRAALKEANTQFEAVGFDTCLMSTLETAEVLKPYAKYMVGSEETEPGYGWDYNSWTSYLSAYPGIDGGTLGKAICDSFYAKCKYWWVEDMATLSVTDLSKLDNLSQAFRNVSGEIVSITGDLNRFRNFTQGAERAESYGGNSRWDGYTDMVDLGDLMGQTEHVIPEYSDDVLAALKDAVIYNIHGSDRANANGLSVFYPLYIDKRIYNAYAEISDNTAYLQYLAIMNGSYSSSGWGNIDLSNYGWQGLSSNWSNYGYGTSIANARSLTPITEKDYDITYTLETTPGSKKEDPGIRLDIQKGKKAVKTVRYSLGYKDDATGYYVYLGTDNDLSANYRKGVFKDSFNGSWMTVGGTVVSYDVIEENKNYILFSIPCLVNDVESSLRIAYNYKTDQYEVKGLCDTLGENGGVAGKSMRMPQKRDKITFLFRATNLNTGKDKTVKGKTITWKDSTKVQDAFLSNGTYYYTFEITDLFGNAENTDSCKCIVTEDSIEMSL